MVLSVEDMENRTYPGHKLRKDHAICPNYLVGDDNDIFKDLR